MNTQVFKMVCFFPQIREAYLQELRSRSVDLENRITSEEKIVADRARSEKQ